YCYVSPDDCLSLLCLLTHLTPSSTLFPYTTLFRSPPKLCGPTRSGSTRPRRGTSTSASICTTAKGSAWNGLATHDRGTQCSSGARWVISSSPTPTPLCCSSVRRPLRPRSAP